jgi:hypothetical protein
VTTSNTSTVTAANNANEWSRKSSRFFFESVKCLDMADKYEFEEEPTMEKLMVFTRDFNARLLTRLTCKLGWKTMWTSFVDSYNYGISTPGRGYLRLEGGEDDRNMETSSL